MPDSTLPPFGGIATPIPRTELFQSALETMQDMGAILASKGFKITINVDTDPQSSIAALLFTEEFAVAAWMICDRYFFIVYPSPEKSEEEVMNALNRLMAYFIMPYRWPVLNSALCR